MAGTSNESLIRIRNSTLMSEIIKDFTCILEEEVNVDMLFICKNRKKVSAHQLILGTSSKFLYTLLNEHPQEFPVVLHIPDIKEEVMKQVLNFIYCGQILLTEKQLKHFYDALNTLGVPLSDTTIPQMNNNSESVDEQIPFLACGIQPSSGQEHHQVATHTQQQSHDPNTPTYLFQNTSSNDGHSNQEMSYTPTTTISNTGFSSTACSGDSVNSEIISEGTMDTVDLTTGESSSNQQSLHNMLDTRTFGTKQKKRKINFREENSSLILRSIVLTDTDTDSNSDDDLLIIG